MMKDAEAEADADAGGSLNFSASSSFFGTVVFFIWKFWEVLTI